MSRNKRAKMDDTLDGPDSKDGLGDSILADTPPGDGDPGGNQEEVETKETVGDQADGFGKTFTKALKVVKQRFRGSPAVDKEKGDNTDGETANPHQPASAVSENDSDAYDFSHQKRGHAIIINNETFKPGSNYGHRTGSKADQKALKEMFQKLGFDVVDYQDCTADDMKKIFEKEAKDYEYHKNADCLAVAILSHGERKYLKDNCIQKDVILGVDGKPIFTDYIMRTFQDSQCPGLAGKPRFFFLQACRGTEYDHGRNILVYYDQTDASAGTQPKELVHSTANIPSSHDSAVDASMTEELVHSTANIPSSHDSAVDASMTEPKETAYNDTSKNAAVDLSSTDKQDKDHAATTAPEEVGCSGMPPTIAGVDLSSVDTGKASTNLGHGTSTDKTDAVGSIADDDDSDDDETDAYGQRPVTERLVLSPAPIFKDYLVMYATAPGHYAWRRTTGSWFVQSLHSVFMKEYTPNMTLTQALTSVVRMVAIGYESQGASPERMGKKQTSVVQSMLVKDVYFSPKGK